MPGPAVAAIRPGTPGSPALPHARTFSSQPGDRERTTLDELLLVHHPLTDEETQAIKDQLGEERFNWLSAFRHREGMCHTDTARALIELAGRQPSTSLGAAASYAGKQMLGGAVVGDLVNTFSIQVEKLKGNAESYSIEELVTKGVPEDCIGVVISAVSGAIDPASRQADAAKTMFEGIGEPGGANHAIAVLKVANGQVYGFDADPFRGNASPFFKVDVEAFRSSVKPKLLAGVVKIPMADTGRAGQ